MSVLLHMRHSLNQEIVEAAPPGTASTDGLQFYTLRDLQSIINLNPEIANGTFQFGVSEQKLNGPEIPGLLVDQCYLCSPERMGPVLVRIKSNALHPLIDDAGVLARRQVRVAATDPKEIEKQ